MGQNGGANIFRRNGVDVGVTSGGHGNQELVINAGPFGGETSDWGVAEILTFR